MGKTTDDARSRSVTNDKLLSGIHKPITRSSSQRQGVISNARIEARSSSTDQFSKKAVSRKQLSNKQSQIAKTNTFVAATDLSNQDESASKMDDGSDVSSTSDVLLVKKQRKRKTTPVFEFAQRVNSNEIKCLLCDKHIREGNGSTANVRRHLGNIHGKTSLKYPSSKRTNSVSLANKKQLDIAAIKCIVKDVRSFNDFKKDGMQQFLNIAIPNYTGPSSRTVKRSLNSMYGDEKLKLKQELAMIEYISLTADLYYNTQRRHYLCITAHYIKPDFKLKSTVLSYRQFYGRKYSKRLNQHINRVLTKYDIKSKVVSITTDNGSDIKAAYQDDFGIRLYCCAHALNLVVQNSLSLWTKKIDDNSENEDDEMTE
ncbi:unnamed protein product [Didymodactylos carnosus]|uniref:BED-type domain-containing protein n=1 Tax=Didymodactylos carnosus TaxID=1234261 RepID=A0A813YBA7_9BILA|nr:unnamed protein product [Didymodactylos carnosus]CAF3667859.1 unnamed protein product [Didymodactylos carnosus]